MDDIIKHYFPDLSDQQYAQYAQLAELYKEWNSKINVISRKDIDNVTTYHILHSLGIAKVIRFVNNSEIMDVGTGGGLPGLPLAIMFPEVKFTLVDSIGKKIKVVDEIRMALGLRNVRAIHGRAEDVIGRFDFITGRAVTDLQVFLSWIRNKIKSKQQNGLPNGLLYLKGGDLETDLLPYKGLAQVFPLNDFFSEEYYETKNVVYIELMK